MHLIKYIILILLIPATVWAGWYYAGSPVPIAHYKFESGALTTDSEGSNTLTNYGADEDSTTYKEGSCSAEFVLANTDYMEITDANLSSDFPLKSGETNNSFTVTFWVYFNTLPGTANQYIVNKYDSGSSNRSFGVCLASADTFYLIAGQATSPYYEYDDGNTGEPAVTGRWYFCAARQYSNKDYELRIWDDTASAWVDTDTVTGGQQHISGTWTEAVEINASPWRVGGSGMDSYWVDGNVDDLRFFNEILTDSEISDIRDEN